jgi:hypothetical protein
MDRSRFAALDVAVTLARDLDTLTSALPGDGRGTTVVVDLARPDALDALAAAVPTGARVLAYGSHVERERLDAARTAGAEVLARSAFFNRLPDLLGD